MFEKIIRFFRSGESKPPLEDEEEIRRLYARKRWEVFLSITLGYGFYYVCRVGISVAKKPMLDSGAMDATQLGWMGSALFFAYAFGKFANGFLADRCNMKRFIPSGLMASAFVNFAVGALLFWLFVVHFEGRPMRQAPLFVNIFWIFIVLWALNGYFQAMGAAPCIVSLNQWFSNRERGTFYGIWFISHNIGEGITFIATAMLVQALGWWYGFLGPAMICTAAAVAMYVFMSDRPQTYGLPCIADYKNDRVETAKTQVSIKEAQLSVLTNPVIWILGLCSACMYVSRYGVTSWGILFLQDAKHYSPVEAASIVSVSSIVGIVGSVGCGLISDRFFESRRSMPNFLFSLMVVVSLCVFYFAPPGHPWIDSAAMAFFGVGISATVIFLGGLIAVDLSPRHATGAAMGLIGVFSYIGAGLQDVISGYLINAGRIVESVVRDGQTVEVVHYDFQHAVYFWIGASVVSTCLALSVWNAKAKE